jgi:transcriptional regulator NrdR family protein
MPRHGIASLRPSAAKAYGVMRCLSLQQGITGRELPEAGEALRRHGLAEIELASREHDQLLLQKTHQGEDQGAFLCLRCRVSWPLEQRVRNLHRQFQRNYGVELLELAAFALNDTGRRLPYCPEPAAQPRRPEPFGVEVIRSFEPELSSLIHWAQQKLVGNPALKTYLRQQGVLMIRDWALLGDTSHRQVVEAVSRLDGHIAPKTAEALHRRYVPLYRQAKLRHFQAAGRQQGWEPDETFLLTLDSQHPASHTKTVLEKIAKAVRRMQSGQWQLQEAALLDGEALERWADANAADGWSKVDADERLQALEVLQLVEGAGMHYTHQMLKGLSVESLERQIWQAWSEGLRQRQIAESCGTNQARVSRTLKEEIRAGEIATLALERLRQTKPKRATAEWAELFRSVEQLREVEGRLMNHLRQPEQEGGISPLRRWVQHALQSSIAPAAEDQGSGEWR